MIGPELSARHKLLSGHRIGRVLGGAIQALEPRQLLSTLVVNGTNGNDRIDVSVDSSFIRATVNGSTIPQPVGLWDAIQVNGLDGKDSIHINSSGSEPVDVFPGNGADIMAACDVINPDTGAGCDLDALSARVYFHAGTDALDDSLTICDANDTGNDEYDIDENPGPMRLVKPEPGFESEEVWWGESNMDVEIDLNNGDNHVNVASNVAMTGTDEFLRITGLNGSALASAGNDTVTFNGTIGGSNLFHYLDGLGDDVFIINGDNFNSGGTIQVTADLLTIVDSGQTSSYTFMADGTQILESGGGRIIYNVSSIGLSSTDATLASSFDILGLGADLTLAAGGGHDSITVGDGTISAADFGTGIDMTLAGGADEDFLLFDDFEQTASQSVSIGGGSVNFANFGTAAFSSFEHAEVRCGTADDTFTVGSGLAPLQDLAVIGNFGADTFNITPSGSTNLAVLGGPETSPGDRLTLTGGGATRGEVATLNPGDGTYTFANRRDVVFSNIEAFTQPGLAPGAADLAAADDSGRFTDDNTTNSTSLTFSGFAKGGNASIVLYRDGVESATILSDATGLWSLSNSSFPSGDSSYAIVVRTQNTSTGLLSFPSPVLNVRVDTVAPAGSTVPNLQSSSDTGISSSDNITNDATPTFSVTAPELVRLVIGSTILADYATPPNITTPVLTDGRHAVSARSVDLAGNQSAATVPLSILVDTVSPTVLASQFLFDAQQAVQYTFSEDVGASLSGDDLNVGAAATPTALVSYTPDIATFRFSSMLMNGNYAATLKVNSVEDRAGNLLPAPDTVNFFVLAADSNHDGVVDVSDLGALASNWQTSPHRFTQGDFNYDGIVDVSDLGILATNWQRSVPAPAAGSTMGNSPSSFPRKVVARRRAGDDLSEVPQPLLG